LSILSLYRKRRNFRRLQHILRVLAKHGFGHVVSHLDMRWLMPWRWFWKRKEGEAGPGMTDPTALAQRISAAMQELGPTFVKLGQMLSTRPDLVPPEFAQEFRKLQDQVEPFDAETAMAIIEEALGRSLSEVFERIEEEPFAAGSLAQVHIARLKGGEKVVVKVKRPDADAKLREDTDLMRDVAILLERHVPESKVLRPQMLVDEFERTVRGELDFVNEASNTARFHEQFEEMKKVHAPRVYWQYTTNRVLVTEWITGENISNFERLERLGIDLRELSKTLLESFLHQFFETGFFHADPHPGNILVNEEGRIGLVDFGMVGHVDDALRSQLTLTVVAVSRKDVDTILDVYADLGVIQTGTDRDELRPEVLELINKYYGVPLRLVDAKQVVNEVLRLARRYEIRLPRDFVLLGKSFATVVGLAQALDPEINISEVIRPYARRLVSQRYSAKRLAESAGATLRQMRDLARTAPRDVQSILRRASQGKFEMQMRHTGLEDHVRELDRIGNRLAFSIITAAIIMSSGLIIAAKIGPVIGSSPFEDVSILGIIGYLFAGVLGLRLLIAISRGGRL